MVFLVTFILAFTFFNWCLFTWFRRCIMTDSYAYYPAPWFIRWGIWVVSFFLSSLLATTISWSFS